MISGLFSSYALQRVAVAGFGFVTVLLAANRLAIESYSAVLQALFLIKFLQIFNLGAVSGFFVSRYTKTGPLAECLPNDEARFALALFLQLLLLGGLSAALATQFAPVYLVGILCFLIMTPILSMEPPYRDRGWFFVSLIPDFLMSVALLSVCLLSLWKDMDISKTLTMFTISLLFVTMSISFYLLINLARFTGLKEFRPLASKEIWELLGLGWPVYFGTVFFVIASSADRLFFPSYGTDEEVARYFLGYQLAMGSMMIISSANFTSVVDLGHAHRSSSIPNTEFIIGKLTRASVIACVSLGVLALGIWILENYFLDPISFHNLSIITLLLGGGLAVHFIAGTITPLLAYLKQQIPMTITMAILALLLCMNNVIVLWAGGGAIWLAAATGFGFAIYGSIAIFYTLWQIVKAQRSQDSSTSAL